MKIDQLSDRPTKSALARVSGLSQARITQLGDIFEGATLGDWVKCLVDHLGEVAAGRVGEDGQFNLVDERARLASEQADRVAMENEQRRGALVERSLLEVALADVGRQIVAVLEGIPAQMKRASATLKARDLAIVKREIDKARAAIADIRLTA